MPHATKDYFLLAERVHGSRIDDLLGRAVYITGDSLKRPTESMIRPPLPTGGPDLKVIEPNLYPEHMEARSAQILLENAVDDSARASITRALSVFYSNKTSEQTKVSAAKFRRITMEEHDLKIRNLLADEKARSAR
ncbi:hypothetical protein SAMD00023353_3300030 [Rosellinia necatrix]|uniref:Uncharacterized protein n=1 Tax=Rosellinia necatrix TaxID=77044 RepID=A0A1W2TAQ2_ROSNE|nr:hypothetical protein SAMD00023353_3300030 [Rosellinia necatrix]